MQISSVESYLSWEILESSSLTYLIVTWFQPSSQSNRCGTYLCIHSIICLLLCNKYMKKDYMCINKILLNKVRQLLNKNLQMLTKFAFQRVPGVK